MPIIPAALQTKLDSGVTTLCRCWILTRNDGVTLGFTDHDGDIVLGVVTCRAGTGLTASEASHRLGLQVDGSEISGALSDEALTEGDLAAGLFDAANVEVWLVDWSDPSLRVLVSKGALGEVRREGSAFSAELRSLTHRLNEQRGRLYTATCHADLGDARCGIDLTGPAYRGAGVVFSLEASATFYAAGLATFADGWFTAGRLTWTTGANAGQSVEVKTHRVDAAGARLVLWQAMPEPIVEGDAFTVAAGCDKRFATCRDRFANAINFRGFPHIPGNDFVMRYPVQGEPGNDGGRMG